MANRFNADSRAKTRCYFINNSTGERHVTQFNPTTVPYSRSVNFATIASPAMNVPKTEYTGGNSCEFTIELWYYDRPYSGKIDSARLFFESLLPPNNNLTIGFIKPPTFIFAYGYVVKTCVLMNFNVEDEYMNADGRPEQTKFTLKVREIA